MSPTSPPGTGARFNLAQYLLDCNRGRAAAHRLHRRRPRAEPMASSSGRVRQVAGALLAGGVRREERVLLLMHDCTDWPVCFLGALYAGIVPVAVNTLLTADDYAYMLQHSRAQAGAGVGDLAADAAAGDGSVDPRGAAGRRVARRCRAGGDGSRLRAVAGSVRAARRSPRRRWPTIPASGSIRRDRPAARKGRCTPMPMPGGPPSCMPGRCSG